jgi:hypothetical protein
VNSRSPKAMLMSAATAAFLLYNITRATEPELTLVILQYALLPCALLG